ncbi:MAG: hypothetical protein ACSLFJ_04260 [Immundisolibacter sp.]|uniref:hypothetical protein n=1 Tax=Immundisolibacter sp. TaxID=1934948 RepID=UPI003EE022D8
MGARTPELLETAAAHKARSALSLADAWMAASVQPASAVLVHKDPEFELLTMPQETLPYK